ncbi:MAG TPA: hypothetical protein VFS73_07825 [Solirubrobacterales bacterium]|jgi:hypothetical protein|nr:hypothetical protein [Solirubrobacterales bacterium]
MNPSRPTHPFRPRYLIAGLAAVVLALLLPAVASAKDRNHDRIPDRWERHHGLSLKVNQAKRDQDRDQLKNRQEWRSGNDPRDDDSDDDGIEDGDEGSGTIAAFDPATGELTINVMNGGSVTGRVTDATEIKCDDGDDQGDEDGDGRGADDDGTDDHGHGDRVARSGDDDPVDDEDSSDDEGEGDESECTVDDLTVGATVHEAELEIEGGDAVWEEIELLR